MKKVLGLAFILFLVTGCFGGKETTTICKSDEDSLEYIIDAEGDEIVYMEVRYEEDDSDYGYTDDELEDLLKSYTDETPKIDGVTYEVESIKDGIVIYLTTYDLTETSMDDLVEAGVLDSSDKDTDYVSLKETIQNLEDDDATCNEK